MRRTFGMLAVCAGALLFADCARATTKGFNQIVTPDIQPVGQFSVSLQAQNPVVGNSLESQFEVGITPRFEVAMFQGFQPGANVWNAEYALVAKGPWLLSTGATNWQARGSQMMGFLEGGYYRGPWHLVAGTAYAGNQLMALVGAGYQATPTLALSADFQSGEENFHTLGFTYNFTPRLSLNPSLYFSNSTPRKTYGYGVLTWTFTAW